MSTLFKQLHALVCQSDGGLMMSIVAGKAGKMTVAVMPKSNQKEASESGLLTPLALTGTPEELDAEFVRCLGEFTGQRQSLAISSRRPPRRWRQRRARQWPRVSLLANRRRCRRRQRKLVSRLRPI